VLACSDHEQTTNVPRQNNVLASPDLSHGAPDIFGWVAGYCGTASRGRLRRLHVSADTDYCQSMMTLDFPTRLHHGLWRD
jgi:hypothetical protein